MKNITERDSKIEARAGAYYIGRRLFFALFLLSVAGLIASAFLASSHPDMEREISSMLAATVIWYLAYKLADYRVQHVETIRQHRP